MGGTLPESGSARARGSLGRRRRFKSPTPSYDAPLSRRHVLGLARDTGRAGGRRSCLAARASHRVADSAAGSGVHRGEQRSTATSDRRGLRRLRSAGEVTGHQPAGTGLLGLRRSPVPGSVRPVRRPAHARRRQQRWTTAVQHLPCRRGRCSAGQDPEAPHSSAGHPRVAQQLRHARAVPQTPNTRCLRYVGSGHQLRTQPLPAARSRAGRIRSIDSASPDRPTNE